MTFELITLETTDSIAVLTLNHPPSRNGMTVQMQTEMLVALAQVAERDDVQALILTGAGQGFCSGADLKQVDQAPQECSVGQSVGKVMKALSNPLVLALQNLPIPVVAAVNGAAAGGGASIALAADIVIAARSAYFVMPFLPRLGIVPDMGASWFLPAHIGRARSLGLTLLGERLPAAQALEWGLIWACVHDAMLMDEAFGIARKLAQAPAHAALEARRAFDAAARNDLATQLDYEAGRQRELLDRPSFCEGSRAFVEKREPKFRR